MLGRVVDDWCGRAWHSGRHPLPVQLWGAPPCNWPRRTDHSLWHRPYNHSKDTTQYTTQPQQGHHSGHYATTARRLHTHDSIHPQQGHYMTTEGTSSMTLQCHSSHHSGQYKTTARTQFRTVNNYSKKSRTPLRTTHKHSNVTTQNSKQS